MNPQHYPLQWPAGWPRTDKTRRENGRFKTTLSGALENLRSQINLLGGANVILSSNCTLGQARPDDCGVVAYFVWNKKQLAVPCDRWTTVEANVQAIALTIEAMRGMERWGAKHMIEAMFTGFKAIGFAGRPWHVVLGVTPSQSNDDVIWGYRNLAKKHHPDVGGTREAWDELERAYSEFKKERGL